MKYLLNCDIIIIRHDLIFCSKFSRNGGYMKIRFFAILILFALLCGVLTSCNDKNDGFTEVASITYTVDGKSKTENSTAVIYLGQMEHITEDEYNRSDSKYQVSSIAGGLSTKLTASTKTVSSVWGINNSDKGKYVYYWYVAWGDMGWMKVRGKDYELGFAKCEITSEIRYNYIKVKVVDDDTIIIKNSKGETTYNVSSYSITHFN